MNSNVNLVEIFYFTDKVHKEIQAMVRGYPLVHDIWKSLR